MNLDDGFFRSEIDFDRTPAKGTLQDEHGARLSSSTWPVRLLINLVAATTLVVCCAAAVEPRIGVAQPDQRRETTQPLQRDYGIAELRSLIDHLEAGEPATTCEATLERASAIVRSLDDEKNPPSDETLTAWLAHFVATAGDC